MSCRHRQARPIELVTGEIVGCLCVECYERLPAQWIERQRRYALLAAYCEHAETIAVRTMHDVEAHNFCVICGIELDLT